MKRKSKTEVIQHVLALEDSSISGHRRPLTPHSLLPRTLQIVVV
jgi:hypothetical protein